MDHFLETVNKVSLFSVHQEPIAQNSLSPDNVKFSCYVRKELQCSNNEKRATTFPVQMLFVQWKNDAIDYWFRAKDVANGLGYDKNDAAFRLKKFLDDKSDMVAWSEICDLLLKLSTNKDVNGCMEANKLLQRTAFITINGLRKILLCSPKCKFNEKKETFPLVYIATSKHLQPQNVYKIGYTRNDISVRLKELNITAHAKEYLLFAYYTFPTSFAEKLEKYLHRYFQSQRLLGEFFKLSEKQLETLKILCKKFDAKYKNKSNLQGTSNQ
jgi:hypothetical protein